MLRDTGDDPVYYLIFEPSDMLEVKRRHKQWQVKLEHDGWIVHTFSIAEAIHEILQNHPLRNVWLKEEKRDPFDFTSINGSLEGALLSKERLDDRLRSQINSIKSIDKALLLVTDVEALHPYTRMNRIESRLQNEFFVPTVILYPGTRSGEHTLSFLGVYPQDPNYRSVHIGG
jgi:hypothetical protein